MNLDLIPSLLIYFLYRMWLFECGAEKPKDAAGVINCIATACDYVKWSVYRRLLRKPARYNVEYADHKPNVAAGYHRLVL